jgi:hypothetical protein
MAPARVAVRCFVHSCEWTTSLFKSLCDKNAKQEFITGRFNESEHIRQTANRLIVYAVRWELSLGKITKGIKLKVVGEINLK